MTTDTITIRLHLDPAPLLEGVAHWQAELAEQDRRRKAMTAYQFAELAGAHVQVVTGYDGVSRVRVQHTEASRAWAAALVRFGERMTEAAAVWRKMQPTVAQMTKAFAQMGQALRTTEEQLEVLAQRAKGCPECSGRYALHLATCSRRPT